MEILNPSVIKVVNSALLQNKPIGFVGPESLRKLYYGARDCVRSVDVAGPFPDDLMAVVSLDAELPADLDVPQLRLRSQPLVLGIGCRRGTSSDEIAKAVDETMRWYDLPFSRVDAVASSVVKSDEAGLLEFADKNGLGLSFFESGDLAEVDVPTPSDMPMKYLGTPSVAEAASVLASEGRLLTPKHICGNVTVAVSVRVHPRVEADAAVCSSGRIFAVGIGSGAVDTMTPQARRALRDSDVIVGYKAYIEQVSPITVGKKILSSGMRQEVDRCKAAIAEAEAGSTVAVICSGDAGVYGMAGLLLELLGDDNDSVELVVIPGVTAALSSAAVLGAPLMNDFAVISLSDLLTERPLIIKRLKAVAESGMPCALYNPRSRKRIELLDEALRIFAEAGGENLACGYVRNAGRSGEIVWAGRISDFKPEDVDMFTTVIIGGPGTDIINGRLVTRRGYKKRGVC